MFAHDQELRSQCRGNHRRLLAFDLGNSDRANESVELTGGNSNLPGERREARALGLRADQADKLESLALQRRRRDVEVERVRVRHDNHQSIARSSGEFLRRMLAM